MKGVLPFMNVMKEISFVLELEDDVTKVKYSIFENPAIVNEDNQGTIAIAVAPKIAASHEGHQNQVPPLTNLRGQQNCKKSTWGYEVTDCRYFY